MSAHLIFLVCELSVIQYCSSNRLSQCNDNEDKTRKMGKASASLGY